MEHAKLEELARGRVYTGRQAKSLGLVDHLGTLADAVAHARNLAGDAESKLELEDLPRPQSPLQFLMGKTESADRPFEVWAALLPAKALPALSRLIADEPALTILPFDVRMD
jgi:protease-4